MQSASSERGALVLGRYVIFDEIAAGGMATVHLGRLMGAAGFARTVAIKRLHPQFAKDPEFVSMFMDEARVTARIRHPNVVTTLDVAAQNGELFVIMEYIHGEPLSRLIRASMKSGQKIPPRIVAAIMAGALHGLHAAHEATDEFGQKLDLVHRDVSPHNILVSTDGVARVLDFGIAKAAGRVSTTREGEIKGKFAYMPPEQLHGEPIDRRADVYAAGVVLWETLTCERLFHGSAEALDLQRLLAADVDPPSTRVPHLPPGFDIVAMRALEREACDRYPSARDMAIALESCVPVAPPSEVSAWVEELVGGSLSKRSRQIVAIEADPAVPSSGVGLDAKGSSGTRDLLQVMGASLNPKETTASNATTLVLPDKTGPEPATIERTRDISEDKTIEIPRGMRIAKPLDKAGGTATRISRVSLDDVRGRPTKPEGRAYRYGSNPEPDRDLSRTSSESFSGARAPRRRVTVVGMSVALIALLIAAAVVGLRGRIHIALPSAPSAPSAPSQPSATWSGEPPQLPSASATAEPSDGAPQPSAAAATPDEAPAASGSAGAAKRPQTVVTPRPPARPHPPAAETCNPPFVIDAQGHKRYKRECL